MQSGHEEHNLSNEKSNEVMTLEEFNRIRKRLGRVSLLAGLSLLPIGLLAGVKQIGLLLFTLLLFIVFAAATLRYIKQLKNFRCPNCGKDPTTWVSENPLTEEGSSRHDQFTIYCLHCEAWLGKVEE